MEPPRKRTQKIYTKAERVYDKLIALREKIRSLKDMELQLDNVRKEIIRTEQHLYEVQMLTLKDVKCLSITLLEIIQKNVPDAHILKEFEDLLKQKNKWCQHQPN